MDKTPDTKHVERSSPKSVTANNSPKAPRTRATTPASLATVTGSPCASPVQAEPAPKASPKLSVSFKGSPTMKSMGSSVCGPKDTPTAGSKTSSPVTRRKSVFMAAT
ncbi:hypothetical protein SEUCBS139899_002121 [Sporothrix eucalyptigena]|uniref:Uncharacterized protein n=1 Tax=Sporothrix eucalyptigena TaxID=1812306 RepID=A0ABP0B4A2_9PEZI